jgi:hypothetical protein
VLRAVSLSAAEQPQADVPSFSFLLLSLLSLVGFLLSSFPQSQNSKHRELIGQLLHKLMRIRMVGERFFGFVSQLVRFLEIS